MIPLKHCYYVAFLVDSDFAFSSSDSEADKLV